jgi:hypothetical protein
MPIPIPATIMLRITCASVVEPSIAANRYIPIMASTAPETLH